MQPNQPPVLMQFLPLIFFIGIFYFLLIRPQQKKQKQHKEMVASIKKNDRIVTVGGIHATVVNVKNNTLIIRIDDNTKAEIDKNSIAAKK
jgi:preprotein translocase subunit YajC